MEPFTIGIINSGISDKYKKIAKKDRIFTYTGKDSEAEAINDFINGRYYSSYSGKKEHRKYLEFGDDQHASKRVMVYWWGYMKAASSLEGGLRNCKRLSYFQLYKQAIVNLQEQYNWRLDEYLVFNVLGFYSLAQSKIYFKDVMEEHNNKIKTK
jgi:hypothetical protein